MEFWGALDPDFRPPSDVWSVNDDGLEPANPMIVLALVAKGLEP